MLGWRRRCWHGRRTTGRERQKWRRPHQPQFRRESGGFGRRCEGLSPDCPVFYLSSPSPTSPLLSLSTNVATGAHEDLHLRWRVLGLNA
jgi:hypothetical protein